jgi:L-xylulokinase
MNYYLGIDNGGTTTKASIYTNTGKEIATASLYTKVISTKPGYAEIDMDEMKKTNSAVIKESLQKSGLSASQITGIAVCGHGKGLYLVDKEGKPCRPGILSGDTRAEKYACIWDANGTAEKIYARTYQKIMPQQAVCLLAWLKDNERDSLKNLKWIFECKDYIRFLLTGEAYAELTDYSGANLVNLLTRNYDKELLGEFGLEEFMQNLPPLVSSTDFCGSITRKAAEETGLKEGTPVYGGMFDIDACAVATNVTDEQHICMIAGTWSINEFISKTPVGNHTVAMNSIFCDPAYYLAEESSPTSAVNFEWWIKTQLPELAEQCKQDGHNIYQEMDKTVESLDDTEFYPFYLPFITASNVNPNATAGFIGLTYCQSRKHLIKSIYEGVVFSHRYHLERLLEGKKIKTPAIRLAGGAANSIPWAQMFADILQKPIEVISTKQTGTLGCAMAVSVAAGDYKNYKEAGDNMVSVSKVFEPDKDRKGFYDHRYHIYKTLLEKLDSFWNLAYK